MKMVSESKRFVVGWGKGSNGLCFFVSHKDINPKYAVPKLPEDLVEYLKDAIQYIESKKSNDKFIEKWGIKKQ